MHAFSALRAFLMLPLALLASCGGGQAPVRSAPAPSQAASAEAASSLTRLSPPAPPPTRPDLAPLPVPQAQVQQVVGLEAVIGSNAAMLIRRFGPPRLDQREGDVRKLQFRGAACVLDVWLYPPEGGGEQRATHVEARRSSDGQDVDRADCATALTGAIP